MSRFYGSLCITPALTRPEVVSLRSRLINIWNSLCYSLLTLVLLMLSNDQRVLLSLWSPYVIGQAIIFLPCDFYLLSSFFLFFLSSPNLSRRRLDVCHTSTHGVALVQI